jgi:hypothetical protein
MYFLIYFEITTLFLKYFKREFFVLIEAQPKAVEETGGGNIII